MRPGQAALCFEVRCKLSDDLRSRSFEELVEDLRSAEWWLRHHEETHVPTIDDPQAWGESHGRKVDWKWRILDEMRTRSEYPAYEADQERRRAEEDARRQEEIRAGAIRRTQEAAERQRKSAPGSVIAGFAAAIAVLSIPCMGLQNE